MMQFKGFKPEANKRIAVKLGYGGDMSGFNTYLKNNPDKQKQMNMYTNKAIQMVQGGYIKHLSGGGDSSISPKQKKYSKYAKDAIKMAQGTIPVNLEYDYNGDGKVDLADAQSLLRIGTGMMGDEEFEIANPAKYAMDIEEYAKSKGYNITNPSDAEIKEIQDNFAQYETDFESGAVDYYGASPTDTATTTTDNVQTTTTANTTGTQTQSSSNTQGTPISQSDWIAANRPTGDAAADNWDAGAGVAAYNSYLENFNSTNNTGTDTGTDTGTGTGTGTGTDTGTGTGTGTDTGTTDVTIDDPIPVPDNTIAQETVDRYLDPKLPEGGKVDAVGTVITEGQIIDDGTGQVTGDVKVDMPDAVDSTQVDAPVKTDAATVDATTVVDDVKKETDKLKPVEGTVDPRAEVEAETETETLVSDVKAAEGEAILIDEESIPERKLDPDEIVTGVVDPTKAAQFTEQIAAAQATPTIKATVQGQLTELMAGFEDGKTPSWAAGAMRAVTGAMAARGLGASSMAGQAMVQAAMESALPIASADASTFAQFEAQNLSNRQARAMLSAEQRAKFMGQKFDQDFQAKVMNASKISDIANMNFTAQQQVMLENSKIANTINLQNLNNNQAVVMANAAALANLDIANLNNRQQAAVQNAQNFMTMDMANLDRQQQTAIFKSQQNIQALFTDQAAINAAKQFNATSQNQTDQFFANLKTQTELSNAANKDAMARFNAGETNAAKKYNADIKNQREQFNASNSLVIAQNNVAWRRSVAAADTEAINRANELNAKSVLDISNKAYDNLWQYYGDSMDYAFKAANNMADRHHSLALQHLKNDALAAENAYKQSSANSAVFGQFISSLFTGGWGTLFG